MIQYPRLAGVMDEHHLDAAALAALAAVDESQIVGALCGRPPSPETRLRVAQALHEPECDLFRAISWPLGADIEEALAGAPSRYVTDPATLRTIEAVMHP